MGHIGWWLVSLPSQKEVQEEIGQPKTVKATILKKKEREKRSDNPLERSVVKRV